MSATIISHEGFSLTLGLPFDKTISIKEAEEIISKSNKPHSDQIKSQKIPSKNKDKSKIKKSSKK